MRGRLGEEDWRAKKIALCVGLLLITSQAWATTNRYSLLYLRPSMGEGDFVTTLGTQNLHSLEWQLYTQGDYIHKPLQLTLKNKVIGSIVDHLLVQHIGGAFAPTSWWQIEASVPIVYLNKWTPPTVPLGSSSNQMDIGDVFIRNRFTFLDRNDHAVGISFNPFVTLPTKHQDHFVGDPKITGGGLIAIDRRLGKRAAVGFNVGADIRERVLLFGLDTSSRLLLGGGVSGFLTHLWDIRLDIYSATPLTNFYKEKESSPTELLLASSVRLGETGLKAQAGGGLALVRAAGAPLFRTTLGLSYTGYRKMKKSPPPPPPPPPPLLQEGWIEPIPLTKSTVYFDYNHTELSRETIQDLNRLIGTLHEKNYDFIIVSGHTDNRGSQGYNLELSRQRAEKVTRYLEENGILKDKVMVQGYGSTQPAGDNETEEGRRLNRRVDIQVAYPASPMPPVPTPPSPTSPTPPAP